MGSFHLFAQASKLSSWPVYSYWSTLGCGKGVWVGECRVGLGKGEIINEVKKKLIKK